MKKFVYPIFRNCSPLPAAIVMDDKSFKLEIDLKNAFHQGYIDRHGVVPANGKNPFLQEYEDLIDNSEDLRFSKMGIGNDTEARIGESAKLGKCLARGILSQYYNYVWFASIQNLLNTPENNWNAIIKDAGDTPDWLVGNRDDFAVAEAKGIHARISIDSDKVNKWRIQAKNIKIQHHGKDQALKTWIIATRFVNTTKPKEKPQMLIEDPPLDGEFINQNSSSSLLRWISKSHIVANLLRIGQFKLIVRLDEQRKEEPITVLVWQCIVPELQKFRFIGRPIGADSFHTIPFFYMEEFLFRPDPRRLFEILREWYDFFSPEGFFDGMEISPVQALIRNAIPEAITFDYNSMQYDFISILSDGSFMAPMSLMRPVDIKEF